MTEKPPQMQPPKHDVRLLTGPVMAEKLGGAGKWHAILQGGLLNNAHLALKIGELIGGSVYGENIMARQRPLEARDDADRWTVFGSFNREMCDGEGPLKIVLRKWDAVVLEVALPSIFTSSKDIGKPPMPKENLERWLSPKGKGESNNG